MSESLTLGYWYIRGLAEPIRYLLHYKNVNFEDKRYWTMESWQEDKFSLGFDFPNLPYLIDGDIKLTQSTTIIRYLAHKYQLDGRTLQEKLRVSLAEQQIIDLRTKFMQLCYSDMAQFQKLKPGFISAAPGQAKAFSEFLGEGKFINGDDVTYVDFMACETLDFYRLFLPTIFDDLSNIKEYIDRIRSIPQIQKYLLSKEYFRWPIFAPFTSFGGRGEYPGTE